MHLNNNHLKLTVLKEMIKCVTPSLLDVSNIIGHPYQLFFVLVKWRSFLFLSHRPW